VSPLVPEGADFYKLDTRPTRWGELPHTQRSLVWREAWSGPSRIREKFGSDCTTAASPNKKEQGTGKLAV
jgi:hypothetical protein